MIHTLQVVLFIYIALCILLYFLQEKIIFLPEKLDKKYSFQSAIPFEEINIKAKDGALLNGLLYKTDSARGLVFYLHGNAGSLRTWGDVARTYTDLGYDVFTWDYRGYGKSESAISSEPQMFEDVQTVYNEIKSRYSEDKIVVLGYSIGTGFAVRLSSDNHPKQLILQAPYFSLSDIMKNRFPLIPTLLLKYKFASHEYLKNCKMPIVIFHGDKDYVIPYQQSLKLKPLLKPGDVFIKLHGQGHNGITENETYKRELKKQLL